MRLSKYALIFGTLVTFTALAVLVTGCQRTSTSSNDGATVSDKDHDHTDAEPDHHHEPGAHGGTIVEVGQDNYHVEAVFDADGKLHLFILGHDESRVQEVEVQELPAYAKPAGGEAVQFTLTADRQKDDTEGKTSAFAGDLPAELRDKKVDITIPSIRIGEDRFRIGFSSEDSDHDANHDEPTVASDGEKETLYLTPGGAYTEADIAANGNTTAAEKFAGLLSNHNLEPSPGDRICPVTLTKANSQFSWIVGGKKYLFCCPPCIDEFVAKAKNNAQELKAPETYVKE